MILLYLLLMIVSIALVIWLLCKIGAGPILIEIIDAILSSSPGKGGGGSWGGGGGFGGGGGGSSW